MLPIFTDVAVDTDIRASTANSHQEAANFSLRCSNDMFANAYFISLRTMGGASHMHSWLIMISTVSLYRPHIHFLLIVLTGMPSSIGATGWDLRIHLAHARWICVNV